MLEESVERSLMNEGLTNNSYVKSCDFIQFLVAYVRFTCLFMGNGPTPTYD